MSVSLHIRLYIRELVHQFLRYLFEILQMLFYLQETALLSESPISDQYGIFPYKLAVQKQILEWKTFLFANMFSRNWV